MLTPQEIRQASEAFVVLQIEPTADMRAVNAAFKKQIKLVHPDLLTGDAEAAKQVNHARDVIERLSESGRLAAAVAAIAELTAAMESIEGPVGRGSGYAPVGSREASIPNYRKSVVLEYAGGGTFNLFLYGEFLRGGLTPHSAVRALHRMLGPRFQGSLADVYVWILVPGVYVRRFSLLELEGGLEAAVPDNEAPRSTRGQHAAPVQQPQSGAPAPSERVAPEEEPPEHLSETFRNVDWAGMYLGYVVFVKGGTVRVFRLKRVRGRVDVTFFGAYESSAAALRDLNRKGLNPDLVPVWLLADVLGAEPTRLGAA